MADKDHLSSDPESEAYRAGYREGRSAAPSRENKSAARPGLFTINKLINRVAGGRSTEGGKASEGGPHFSLSAANVPTPNEDIFNIAWGPQAVARLAQFEAEGGDIEQAIAAGISIALLMNSEEHRDSKLLVQKTDGSMHMIAFEY